MDRNSMAEKEQRTGNSTLKKLAVQRSASTFVMRIAINPIDKALY
jgi:hypothetical protein